MIYLKKLENIKIPSDRQREIFDQTAHQELIISIEEVGLINAICVRKPYKSEIEDGIYLETDLILIAGERRLRAMKEIYELGGKVKFSELYIPHESVPCTLYEELTVAEAVQIELDENIKRSNITWQEQAKATKRLNELLGKLSQEKHEPPPTVAKLTELITGKTGGSSQDMVRTDLIVAKHLDNPAISKAGSAKEALKILKREEESNKNRQLALEIGETYGKSNNLIYCGNCLDILSDLKYEGHFDVILTDPPYGMNADQFGDSGGKLQAEHKYDDSRDTWFELMKAFSVLSYKITKDQAHAYIFCDIEQFFELKYLMTQAGWAVFRTPLTSRKLNSGRVPDPTCGPRRQAEWILYAIKGRKPVKMIAPDVIDNKGDNPFQHAAGKSTELFLELLNRSTSPGDNVLDAFAGTFTILRAAKPLQLNTVAIELDEASYGMGITELNRLYGE